MTIVTAIFNAIAALPKILEYVEKLALFILDQVNIARTLKARKDAEEAAAKAKETKDTTDLDKLFNPDKK